jgi:hypothetical protein
MSPHHLVAIANVAPEDISDNSHPEPNQPTDEHMDEWPWSANAECG